MEQDLEVVVYSENVVGFNALIMEYIDILDKSVMLSQKQFVDKMHRLLPLIYLKAIILPDTEPIMPEMIDKVVTQEEWDAVHGTLSGKLGEHDAYQEVFDPLSESGNEMSSLAEGFTDVFQDLRDYLSLYNMGTAEIMNDAIWDCKNNFKQFWGQRLVNIQRVLHHLLYGGVVLNDTDALSDDDFDLEKRFKKNLKNDEA